MSYKITDNASRFSADTTQHASVFLRLFADGVYDSARPITPKDMGNLRNDVKRQVLGLHGEIRWAKNYAQAQEAGQTQGRPIRHYTTPGTGAHYAEKTINKEVKNTLQYAKRAGLV